MIVLIRGAGDLATGIALRLFHSGFQVVMTELAHPMTIRRTVAFSEAIRTGKTTVEDVTAIRVHTPQEAKNAMEQHLIPVLADPECLCREILKPDALVDAILAKKNLGTKLTDAPVVIGVGPGFTAGIDCHAVVETMRGHTLGRAIYDGPALPNTNIPGLIGGFAGERVLRAPADGIFRTEAQIGDHVKEGDIVGYVGDQPMRSTISGVLRGLIADGTPVCQGLKSGDVDPRNDASYCTTSSDKALAIGGGVLEAILFLGKYLSH